MERPVKRKRIEITEASDPTSSESPEKSTRKEKRTIFTEVSVSRGSAPSVHKRKFEETSGESIAKGKKPSLKVVAYPHFFLFFGLSWARVYLAVRLHGFPSYEPDAESYLRC